MIRRKERWGYRRRYIEGPVLIDMGRISSRRYFTIVPISFGPDPVLGMIQRGLANVNVDIYMYVAHF